MLNATYLSRQPLRQGNANACLLISYAAALYPFTLTNEIEYFVDCCTLLGIKLTSPGDGLNLLTPQLIDARIGTKTRGSGYDWIEELHDNCTGHSFDIARSRASITRKLSREQVENSLRDKRCASIFALHFSNGDSHSICIINDPTYGFVSRDSARPICAPEPLIDAAATTLEKVVQILYRQQGIKIGESILFAPQNNFA